MGYEYKTIDTTTLKGLKQAERLHIAGWKTIRLGLTYIQFERYKEPKSFMERLTESREGFARARSTVKL